mmetsp:Transcript_5520/g.14980  ORF Transcript_5520/g.14980 Transcript_5520/m.14980 type:complete len:303 (+) Transcript_5520:970-1878(+)
MILAPCSGRVQYGELRQEWIRITQVCRGEAARAIPGHHVCYPRPQKRKKSKQQRRGEAMRRAARQTVSCNVCTSIPILWEWVNFQTKVLRDQFQASGQNKDDTRKAARRSGGASTNRDTISSNQHPQIFLREDKDMLTGSKRSTATSEAANAYHPATVRDRRHDDLSHRRVLKSCVVALSFFIVLCRHVVACCWLCVQVILNRVQIVRIGTDLDIHANVPSFCPPSALLYCLLESSLACTKTPTSDAICIRSSVPNARRCSTSLIPSSKRPSIWPSNFNDTTRRDSSWMTSTMAYPFVVHRS